MGDEYVMTSETHPIYADFVPEEHTKVPGRLGMTFAPLFRSGRDPLQYLLTGVF